MDLFKKWTKDGAILDQQIAFISDHTKMGREYIQIAGIGAIMRAIEHSDITKLQQLDKAMDDGWFQTAFRRWAVTHGPVIWKTKDKETKTEAGFYFSAEKHEKLKAKVAADGEGAVADGIALKKWYKAEKDKTDFEGFSLLDYLKRGVSKVEKIAGDEGKAKHPKFKPEGLAAVQALISDIESGKYGKALH